MKQRHEAKLIMRLPHDFVFCRMPAIAVMVFQFRVVAKTPKTLSSWPRQRIAFISRRYRPRTNLSFTARIFKDHSLFEGRLKGVEGKGRPRFANMLTNQMIFGPEGWPANGFADFSARTSSPGQITTSVSNGNRFASSARSLA